MTSHAEFGLELLLTAWSASGDSPDSANLEFSALVDQVFGGKETGYKKALIIQAAGKAADPEIDAQAMQRGEGYLGSWDAREFAKQSFVKWNLEANEPFSHSADPYVSNPYRIPRFDESQRAQRKKKDEFDAALAVLQRLNQTNEFETAFQNLIEILRGLRRWIADKDISYPLPNRASLSSVDAALELFLSVKSGGTRLQATVAALVASLANAGLKISEVASSHVNSADTSRQRAGDVSFVAEDRSSAIEVKDRPLSRDELEASINKARVASVTDLLFVVRSQKLLEADFELKDFEKTVERQFSSGLNVYVEDFTVFSRICLTIVGELGRRSFLQEVGKCLAEQGADISHKWAWAAIVKGM